MQELEKQFKAGGGSFEEYRIGDLFYIVSNPQLDKVNFHFAENSKYPYFTRTENNNGILGYVDYLDDKHLIQGNSLAVGMISMCFHYMSHDFYAGQFTKTAFPKFDCFNETIAMYFIALLNKFQKLYQGVLVRDFEQTFYNSIVSLPTAGGKIDFSYMESVIRELEEERIRELSTYLAASGLDNTELSEQEKAAVQKLRQGKVQWQEFKVGELFEIQKGKRLTKADMQEGETNFLGAISTNNGIRQKIKAPFTWESNCITVNYNGSVGYSFYQEEPFYASDDVNVCYAKDWEMNKERALFLCTHLFKYSQKFNYTQKWTVERMNNSIIHLPVAATGEIDWDFMQTLITAESRLAIRGVVAWKDKVVEKTKEVVRG